MLLEKGFLDLIDFTLIYRTHVKPLFRISSDYRATGLSTRNSRSCQVQLEEMARQHKMNDIKKREAWSILKKAATIVF